MVPPHIRESTELLLARMLNEYAYCPRLFYLEYIYREWADSNHTLEGQAVHRRVDEEVGELPDPAELLASDEQFQARSILLSAPKLGIIARMDLIETVHGRVRPVDYKKGAPGPSGPWEPECIQLCAQGLILRENGYQCEEGVIYYASTKQRFVTPFDEALVGRTLEFLKEAQQTASQDQMPPPLKDSPKCPRCSLVGICLPDEVNLLHGRPVEEVRRLLPARDDAAPVYVSEQGAFIGKSEDRLSIRRRDQTTEFVRLLDASQVSIFGNVQLSTQALRSLIERDIPVFYFTYGGRLIGVTTSLLGINAPLRCAQHRLAESPEESLRIARMVVAGKIKNQRTLLRRNASQLPSQVLTELARLWRLARTAPGAEQLLGLEGAAALLYFRHFAQMLNDPMGFDAHGRERRPPPDPINALLSFLYSLLCKDALHAVLAIGLDPYCGFYHRLRAGRPSLALDLMEEFRPLIADSVVLSLVNNRMVSRSDFIFRGPACAIKDEARRRVIQAYEARMDTLIRHPRFGYRISYRRALEVQARLLARTIAGELHHYPPLTTR